MRKYMLCFMMILMLFSVGCHSAIDQYSGQAVNSSMTIVGENIDTFDFDSILQDYKEGDPGVKTEGFVNATPRSINDRDTAITLASKECTVEYDAIDVGYDPSSKVWVVMFYRKDFIGVNGELYAVCGGDEEVYIDSNGITQLIVYGE